MRLRKPSNQFRGYLDLGS